MRDVEDSIHESLRRLCAAQATRFDRIDATLTDVLTQMRIHGTHFAGLVQQEKRHPQQDDQA